MKSTPVPLTAVPKDTQHTDSRVRVLREIRAARLFVVRVISHELTDHGIGASIATQYGHVEPDACQCCKQVLFGASE